MGMFVKAKCPRCCDPLEFCTCNEKDDGTNNLSARLSRLEEDNDDKDRKIRELERKLEKSGKKKCRR